MGGTISKRSGAAPVTAANAVDHGPDDGSDASQVTCGRRKLKHQNSLSEFNFVDMASSLTHRFSVLSGLSFISFVNIPAETNRRPWSRISRKRWHPSTLRSEYAHSKAVWPVAQSEALFLPEFPVGLEEKLKLVFMGEISRGAFGQVFHVQCAKTEKEFAMKVLSKSQVCSLDAIVQVKQEVMIQRVCSHHTFITPLAHFWQTRKLLIVMTEYVGYGELQQLWRSLGRMPENLIKIYLAEIALALDFLHSAGVIYRDLKMENILLDVDGHIKIIDFGLAKWLSYGGRTRTICGTLNFMAPEVLLGEEYWHSADWWSLGIIGYCLLIGSYPVSGHNNHVTMSQAVEKHEYKINESVSPQLKSVICGLLNRDQNARIHSLYQLQKEQLFYSVDFDNVKERKISPRRLLEEYIDSKTRHSFVEFAGLTSTPKKTLNASPQILPSPRHDPMVPPLQTNVLPNPVNPSQRRIEWRKASHRSVSSPLLLPGGRLGHHGATSNYQGAGVPILQSPLLRLAKGEARRVRSQETVSASEFPTAVSPLLVNVKGPRKARWEMGSKMDSERVKLLGKQGNERTIIKGKMGLMNGTGLDDSSDDSGDQLLSNGNFRVKRGSGDFVFHHSFLDNCDLEERLFCDLIASTPQQEGAMSLGQLANKPEGAIIASLPNGTVISGLNVSALDEKDFDSTFDSFPWISESLESRR